MCEGAVSGDPQHGSEGTSQDKLHFFPAAYWRKQILFILCLKGGGFALVFLSHLVLFLASFHSADFSINRGKVLISTALPCPESFRVFSPGDAAVGQGRVSTAVTPLGAGQTLQHLHPTALIWCQATAFAPKLSQGQGFVLELLWLWDLNENTVPWVCVTPGLPCPHLFHSLLLLSMCIPLQRG